MDAGQRSDGPPTGRIIGLDVPVSDEFLVFKETLLELHMALESLLRDDEEAPDGQAVLDVLGDVGLLRQLLEEAEAAGVGAARAGGRSATPRSSPAGPHS